MTDLFMFGAGVLSGLLILAAAAVTAWACAKRRARREGYVDV